MADTVTSNVMFSATNARRYIVHLTCISDGTGETNVVKIDKSTLTNGSGVEPTSLKIASIRWNIQGMSYVKLSTDRTTDQTLMVLSGNGYDNFEAFGHLKEASTTGDTGDLLLSSVGAASGATYDITLECVL
jgi:hypothetical protein